MAILSVQTPFEDSNTVTSSSLNQLVTQASFTSSAVDNDSTQISGTAIVVADGGIDKTKLDSNLQGFLELSGSAYIGGDKSGNTRGANAIDISPSRGQTSDVASGVDSIVLGRSSRASGTNSIAIGKSANANTADCIAIGNSSNTLGTNSVSIGSNSNSSGGTKSVAIGYANSSQGEKSVSIGSDSKAQDQGGIAIGESSDAIGEDAISIGAHTRAGTSATSSDPAVGGIAIGSTINSSGSSVVVGTNSYATGLSGLAFGKQNTVSGTSNSNAYGVGNTVSGEESASFGQFNNVAQNRGIAIGRNIEMGGTANGTVEIGNWNSTKTSRQGAVNIKDNNQVSFTINSTLTAPTDGGATAGHEDDGELGRGMWTIQLEYDNDIILYVNDGGVIRSLTLGSLP